ncbi:hypothetical protein MZG30_22255, partial [Escherichia coli]|nr:hypothetical protein [Escherichia coli]
DRNRSHWSTSKTPSYTKSVSWQHHQIRGITIPLPPLNQQNLILSRIREYILVCENLKTSTQSAQQTQLHLADALTDAAIN